MSGKSKSFGRLIGQWLAPVSAPIAFVVVYLLLLLCAEVAFHCFFSSHLARPAVGPRQLGLHDLRDSLLAFGVIAYAVLRVVCAHPWFQPSYADWLKQSPWRPGLPLPLGPVPLVPQDGLVIIVTWLWSFDGSIFRLPHLLSMALAAYLIANLLPLWTAGERVRVFAISSGLAVAAWLGIGSVWSLAVLAVCYMAVFSVMAKSVASAIAGKNAGSPAVAAFFGRTKESVRLAGPIGFPFHRAAQISGLPQISQRDAVLLSATLAIWQFAIASYFEGPARVLASCFGAASLVIVVSLLRVIRYSEYHPPLSFLGRLANRRWIIPAYDCVFLPSLYACAPLLILAMLGYCSPNDVIWAAPLVAFAGCTIGLGMRPTLRHWALCGYNRLPIATSAAPQSEFIVV